MGSGWVEGSEALGGFVEEVGDEAAGDGFEDVAGDFGVAASDSLELATAAEFDGAPESADGRGGIFGPMGDDALDVAVEFGEEGSAGFEGCELAEVGEGGDAGVGGVGAAGGGEVENGGGGHGGRLEDRGIAAEGDDGEVVVGEAGEGIEGVPGIGPGWLPGWAGAGGEGDAGDAEGAACTADGGGGGPGASDEE